MRRPWPGRAPALRCTFGCGSAALRYPLFPPCFSDRALRRVKEYHEKVEHIYLNPVKAGLVSRPEDWRWSSVHDYTGNINDAPVTPSGLSVDRVSLPAAPRTRI